MKGSVDNMKFEQLVELIQTVSSSNLGEFKYEEGDFKISLKKEKGEVRSIDIVNRLNFSKPSVSVAMKQ